MHEKEEVVRKIIETIDISKPVSRMNKIIDYLESLDKKLDLINQKLDKVIVEKIESKDVKEIHLKILNMLDGWMNTSDLAKILNFRQEYISRRVGELKKMDLIEEKRQGKNVFYRRINQHIS